MFFLGCHLSGLIHLHCDTISSAFAVLTPSWKSSLTIITGAVPQPARHSTNSTVNFPSLVVCGPCACASRPSFSQQYWCNACEPPSAQLSVRQTLIWYLPIGSDRNIG